MAFCEKCGNKIADNAAFCGNCGNKVNNQGYNEDANNVQANREIIVINTNQPRQNTGWGSWSTTGKVLWVILNIYTIGIPTLIYACCKK